MNRVQEQTQADTQSGCAKTNAKHDHRVAAAKV
jgi:hypothetical protein